MRLSLPVFFISFAIAYSLQCESAPNAIQACLDLQFAKSAASAAASAANKPSPLASGSQAPVLTYSLVAPNELVRGCDERGDLESIKQALRYQIKRCEQTVPAFDKTTFTLGCRTYQRADWCLNANRKLLTLANHSKDTSQFLELARTHLNWYRSSGAAESSTEGHYQKGETQFTGYYTPLLDASRTRTPKYKYPIYAKPTDLVEIPSSSQANCGFNSSKKPIKWCRKNDDGSYSPYLTRAQIENGALKGRGLEIAYLADPLDVAFMMIQGSATLQITKDNGTKELLRANFAAKNGRRLQMLGRVIRCDGGTKDDFSSMHGIKSYLREQGSARMAELMNYDESYVFFREMPEGPLGSEEVPVTALHSLAVDRDLLPPGSAVLFDIKKSQASGNSCSHITSLALAQDTGGAIKGAHVDWYVGAGEKAAALASAMNNSGLIYIGVPKDAGTRLKSCID